MKLYAERAAARQSSSRNRRPKLHATSVTLHSVLRALAR